MMKKKYKLTISYDGSEYGGWQYQPNTLTIQEVIEKAFETLFRKKIPVVASSRTDAGVHALGQVAQIVLEESVEPSKLLYSLNGLLPRDIRIIHIEEVPLDFHVRFDAKKKIYHYHLWCDLFHNPCLRHYSYHVRHKIDEAVLKRAASYFIGTHNFKAFANENSKGAAESCPVKTLYALNIVKQPGGYRLEFEGSGFLYKMVRNIVGTLLSCAQGKLAPSQIPEIFEKQDRRLLPKSAPAHGLFLMEIIYPTLNIEKILIVRENDLPQ